MVYREIKDGDNPNKGRYEGCCNVRSCMQEHSELTPIHYYNFGTGSYYCAECAKRINEAGVPHETRKLCGTYPMVQKLSPEEVLEIGDPYGQSLEDLKIKESV